MRTAFFPSLSPVRPVRVAASPPGPVSVGHPSQSSPESGCGLAVDETDWQLPRPRCRFHMHSIHPWRSPATDSIDGASSSRLLSHQAAVNDWVPRQVAMGHIPYDLCYSHRHTLTHSSADVGRHQPIATLPSCEPKQPFRHKMLTVCSKSSP
jgi:hypothetical protein